MKRFDSLTEAKLPLNRVAKAMKSGLREMNKLVPKIISDVEKKLDSGVDYEDFWNDEDLADLFGEVPRMMDELGKISYGFENAEFNIKYAYGRGLKPKQIEKEKEIVKKYDKKEVKLAKKNSKDLEKVFKKINKQIGTRWH